MFRLKIWLIIFSIMLILLDKFSFISKMRDTVAVFIQKQVQLFYYRATNYPSLIFLQHRKQTQLEKENQQLKEQVEQFSLLTKQQTNQKQNESELNSLKIIQQQYDRFDILIARAVIDVNYLINNKLLIDKGSINGVKMGQAVVNKDGVIGQVISVNQNSAQIILVTNQDYKIYLQNSVTKSKMLAQGAGNNTLIVKYINKNEKPSIGDILLTTGLDDIYPGNIPVAKITKVFNENNGFDSAICEPVVNFDKLQFISVLENAK